MKKRITQTKKLQKKYKAGMLSWLRRHTSRVAPTAAHAPEATAAHAPEATAAHAPEATAAHAPEATAAHAPEATAAHAPEATAARQMKKEIKSLEYYTTLLKNRIYFSNRLETDIYWLTEISVHNQKVKDFMYIYKVDISHLLIDESIIRDAQMKTEKNDLDLYKRYIRNQIYSYYTYIRDDNVWFSNELTREELIIRIRAFNKWVKDFMDRHNVDISHLLIDELTIFDEIEHLHRDTYHLPVSNPNNHTLPELRKQQAEERQNLTLLEQTNVAGLLGPHTHAVGTHTENLNNMATLAKGLNANQKKPSNKPLNNTKKN